jgi:hypothetical protein
MSRWKRTRCHTRRTKFLKEATEEGYIRIEPWGPSMNFCLSIDRKQLRRLKDGVLRVVLPKKEEIRPQQIAVET